jgi:hypothetical protein
MAQGVLPFKYEEEKKNFCTTALGGSLLFLDLLKKMSFFKIVRDNLRAKEGKQGWGDLQFLICLILLNLCGGDCVDDVNRMEADGGLRLILKHLELRSCFGRRRQELKRQWRNGKKNVFPSPSAIFRYLLLFHNADEEKRREAHRAFIPESNQYLLGLERINKAMLEFLQLNNPQHIATIDMDATVVESNKEEALYSYKKIKGFQPFNSWWWEQDYAVYTEFRDGNVPAGFDQTRVFINTLDCLPEGIEKVYLRSDTAGNQHKLLKYCEMGENKRFGRVEFAIGCDVVEEFKKAVYKVAECDWQPICKELEIKVNGKVEVKRLETGQEWAELCYVPNGISRSKKGPDYRYLAIREVMYERELPGDDMEELCQQTLPFPNVKINNKRYKLFGVVTNMDWDGESIIHWHRKRCGYSEHVHSEMKEEFCGGQLPSGRFGANAAWWWIMLISLNLTSIMKSIVLGKSWKKRRMKSIRFSIINIAGRVIKKGKELVIRLSKGHPALSLLLNARRRIASLCSVSTNFSLTELPEPGG